MEVMEPHLREHGIECNRWTATEHENGVVGLIQTMHSLFTWAVKREKSHILVLEDDNQWLLDFWPAMDEIWPQVPKDYHCLFLSCNLLSRPERISPNILRIGSSYSTNAIVYSLEAMKLILPLLEQFPTTAYDITIMKHIQPLSKTYACIPMLSEQRFGYSSIEKRNINWAEYQQQSFKMFTNGI